MTSADAAVDATASRLDAATAVERLYDTERARLLRIAALLVGDRTAAEDVVQEAFAALYRCWAKLADPDAAAGYLSVSVTNGARSVLRRRRVALRHLRVSAPETSPGADTTVLLAAEHHAVAAAVRRLPRRQQQVVVLRYWDDLSEARIAAVLGISRGTVKSNAARGLANVRRQLTEQNQLEEP